MKFTKTHGKHRYILETSARERANGTYHREAGRHCESPERERKKMYEGKCKRAPSRSGRRPVRSSGPLRCAGFVAMTLVAYALMPYVLRAMLLAADGMRVALGMGSVL